MKEDIKAIAKARIFDGLSEADVAAVLPYLEPKIQKYKKGAYIVNVGDDITDVFAVLEGSVQLVREDVFGARSLFVRNVSGETFFGSFASLKMKSPISCYTLSDSIVMLFNYDNIGKIPPPLSRVQAQIGSNFILTLAAKAYQVYMQIEHVSRPTIRDKILSYLAAQVKKAEAGEFVIPMSKTDLADFLFINRSAMSREFSLLRKEGIIDFKGRKVTIKKDISL